MFWGHIMEPNKRYTQTVEKSFHVSMASLDAVTAGSDIVQVMLYYDDRNYLLCSLKRDINWQVPLDLNFQEGTEITFTCNGRGRVHLTGYLIPDDSMDMGDLEEEEEDEEEDDNEVLQMVGNQIKRKAQESPKESKKLKRLKSIKAQEESSENEEDDDENDDDDEQDESLEIDGEGEDDSDDAEDDDDEEEEEDDDSEEEEEEVKPQQKKAKQKEQQQQANKKQEKTKMVNGKDAKPEPTKQEKKKGKAEQIQLPQQQQQKKGKSDQQQQNNAQQPQKKRVIEGGVQIEDVKVGNGANAKSGKFVSVYYVGRLTNGKKFDATTQGEGFKFRLGKGEVIKGWDVGIAGMKIGGKRRITIPPGMAYGAKGSPPVIPGNSTLVFEVELKNVH